MSTLSAPGRTLPNSTEAEEFLLSCCFIDGSDVLSRCLEARIRPESFYDPKHSIVFGCLLDMQARGLTIDISICAEELKASRQLDAIGGYAFLTQVSSRIPTTAQASYFIKKVREMALLREIIRSATGIVEDCYGYSDTSIEEFADKQIERLLRVRGESPEAEPTFPAVIDHALAYADELIAAKGAPTKEEIPFPWEAMNRRFGPMRRGQFVVIGARTSVGKSSLVRPVALHVARKGLKSYFVTLEVDPVQVVLQMAAGASRMGLKQLPKAHPADQKTFRDHLNGLRSLGITMARKDRTLAQIVGRARALKARHGLDMLVLDHGGLLKDIYEARKDEKQAAIGRVTKTLQQLAAELDIVVVFLWQLNRDSDKDNNREPTLSDLRDCGSVEEEADKVLLIHRPNERPDKVQQKATSPIEDVPWFFTNVFQAKGRNDGTDWLSMKFDRATASFSPYEEKPIGSAFL